MEMAFCEVDEGVFFMYEDTLYIKSFYWDEFDRMHTICYKFNPTNGCFGDQFNSDDIFNDNTIVNTVKVAITVLPK